MTSFLTASTTEYQQGKAITRTATELFFGYVFDGDEDTIKEQAGCFCERCPFVGTCDHCDLCYGCTVWEYMMGDDL